MKNILKTISCSVLSGLIISSTVALVSAESNDQESKFTGIDIGFISNLTYSSYYDEHRNTVKPSEGVDIDSSKITRLQNAEVLESYSDVAKVAKFSEHGGFIEYSADIPQGIYHLELSYISKTDNTTELEISVQIDNDFPFDDAQNLTLTRVWQDETAIHQDNRGNDILPMQKESQQWRQEMLFDRQGFYQDPYYFYFSGGVHTIKILCDQDNVLLSKIRLCNDSGTKTYEEYRSENLSDEPGKAIFQESEAASSKSSSTLFPTMDRSSCKTSPADPVKLKYNTIGQSNFSFNGQWIEWKVKVEKAGIYNLTFRARQNIARGMNSHRAITIDDEIPFNEISDVVFPYGKNFYYKTLGDEDPFEIFLSEGEHTIKMEVIPSEVSNTMRIVNDVVYELNSIYRSLLMVVGPSPDVFTDYYVEVQIPDLLKRLRSISEELKVQKKYLDGLSESKASSSTEMEQMAVMLDSMIEKPETIPYRMSIFQSNISSISAWVSSVSAQPLELDYLLLSPPGDTLEKVDGNFFESLAFGIRAIIGSYFENYSLLDTTGSPDSIRVWVGVGRDQAQVIKQMTDSYFTPQKKINVDLSLVQGSIMEATMAGKGPDVILFAGDGMPMNLAARNALVDLTEFPDFGDLIPLFNKGSMTPYQFKSGYYGLPLQQSFPVMFYRKDVLSELGVTKLPDTWKEFYALIPTIQRANLTIGMGDTNVMQLNASQSPNFGFVFPSLIFQQNESFYNEERNATNFENEKILNAFSEWTNLYTQYNLPLQYDLFNRFRTGEMPIAIAPYTTYNQISFAAPEIKGLWGIAPVPGTPDEKGIVHREVAASGSSGALIFRDAKNHDACFEYIKWFSSEEMQTIYGRNIETLMGSAARYDTANLNALKKLPWSLKEQKILAAQQQYVKEVPVIPSTYYVNREVANAFRKVIYDIEDPRETLILYNRRINEEITRKNKELGISSLQD